MKIFVTGSSGFIGTELVSHLSGKHDIVGYDLATGDDILDYGNLRNKMKGCDAVVHLAAIPKPMEDKDFEDYFRNNCEGTLNVVRAAVENDVKRIIFTSSTTYYGIEKGIPFPTPIKETNPIITQHLKADDLECRECDISYSTSKVISEQILANYGLTKKIEVIILRIGPTRPRGEFRPFLGTHLRMENCLQAIEKSVETTRKIWYDAFTITDEMEDIDITKAKDILDYNPE